uniref:GPI-anchored protein LLG1-like domain-containing protein n=1 Tax=Kalanchoe fedtschenkoi TaxID=63787 RepID=A0A7N0TUD4_KALFE
MFAKEGFHVLLFFFFLIGFAASQRFISEDALHSHGSVSRHLLQAKAACTEDFENKNYTILTSQCKGPRFTAEACCTAFKEFACPFVDKINDENSDCATTMFSYINLYGKYPPGLFANLCREGKDGLACPANETTPASVKDQKSNVGSKNSGSPLLMLFGGLVGGMLIHFF